MIERNLGMQDIDVQVVSVDPLLARWARCRYLDRPDDTLRISVNLLQKWGIFPAPGPKIRIHGEVVDWDGEWGPVWTYADGTYVKELAG